MVDQEHQTFEENEQLKREEPKSMNKVNDLWENRINDRQTL